jgi:hypothetical protein
MMLGKASQEELQQLVSDVGDGNNHPNTVKNEVAKLLPNRIATKGIINPGL